MSKKKYSFSTKTRFSRRKEYFTSEILFYSGNLSFFREILVEIPGFFFGGKDGFVIKIPVLTPKTRFSLRKEYFTSEILFYSGNLSFCREKLAEIPGFFEGKDRCVIKIPVLTPKTRFSRRKEYFTSEIVFYSGNLSFCIEKLVEISCFFRWKRPFRNKNNIFKTENEVF